MRDNLMTAPVGNVYWDVGGRAASYSITIAWVVPRPSEREKEEKR